MMATLTAERIASDLASGALVVPFAARRVAERTTNDPLVASKGAGSIHLLHRDGHAIGYAVWSCRTQSWVCGSWRSPTDYQTAERHLRNMPWEG